MAGATIDPTEWRADFPSEAIAKEARTDDLVVIGGHFCSWPQTGPCRAGGVDAARRGRRSDRLEGHARGASHGPERSAVPAGRGTGHNIRNGR